MYTRTYIYILYIYTYEYIYIYIYIIREENPRGKSIEYECSMLPDIKV